nr:hypothetical protein [Mycobacterium genavense]
MNSVDQHPEARADALARVLAYRTRGRAKPLPIRAGLAVLGGMLLVASIPLIVLLPEVGIPAPLVAFRLLAVEALWAARLRVDRLAFFATAAMVRPPVACGARRHRRELDSVGGGNRRCLCLRVHLRPPGGNQSRVT